jgi:putative copper resistance protein D
MFLPHLDAWSVLPVLALLGLAAYLVGVVRLRRRGGLAWWRTASWVLGCLSLFAVTGTWLNGYSMVLFSVHMSQHMVLSMVAPLLMLLGCPVTLALRTLPRGRGVAGVPRALLLDALHSRVARFVSHPLFTLPLFLVSLYGVYFTPVFDALMGDPLGHQFMLAHFTVTGLLFFGPILAQDPWPRQVGHAGRMLELLIPMPLHAFFGVAIMMSTSLVVRTFAEPPAAWGSTRWPTRTPPAASPGPSASCRRCWSSPSCCSAGWGRRSGAVAGSTGWPPAPTTPSSRPTTPVCAPSPPAGDVRAGPAAGPAPSVRDPGAAGSVSRRGRGCPAGDVVPGRLDQQAGHDRAGHQQGGGPGERRRVALHLTLQADRGVPRVGP